MKFILGFIAAILVLSSTPLPAQSQPQKRRTVTAAKRRAGSIKRGPSAAADSKSSPVTTPTGLIYVITRHGAGPQAKPGNTVSVNYTGVLTDGTKFDSSLDRGQPFSFELGVSPVIKGWNEAIAKLHVGDQVTLIIPPALGYGATGFGPIPPDATLIFIVELLGIQEKAASN